jgi:ferritin
MISKKMQDALNNQINEEYFSSYLYLAMSAYFKSINLNGFAHWMNLQSAEEMSHAMKMFAYINEQQGRVTLQAIAKPQLDWKSPLAAFETTYKHEQKITGLINKLADIAMAEKDHATLNFLNWFVTEQVEEEAQASEIVEKLKMIKEAPQGLLMFDSILGGRK